MKPANETELSEAIRGATGPLRIVGGGTRTIGRIVEGEVLDTRALSGITLYEPGALTMVARAGTPLAEIEAALAAENQRLAFEPGDMRGLLGRTGVSTIGGVVAANASGPRRIQVGACRDHILGVRFVDGSGSVIKNGGRVMKNVTGYDLVKLMSGSHGTLGVLSEVSFKVLPCPETEATIGIVGLNAGQAVRAMARALGSAFEVSGAAYGPVLGAGDKGTTWLRVEGFAASVAYRCQRLTALLAEFGEITAEADAAKSAEIWRGIRDAAMFRDASQVVRLSLKPSEFAGFSARAHQAGYSGPFLLDWAGGLAWLAADSGQPPALDRGLLEHCQADCARVGGHATLFKGSDAVRLAAASFQPETAPLARLSEGLRARFDPRRILNTGLMG